VELPLCLAGPRAGCQPTRGRGEGREEMGRARGPEWEKGKESSPRWFFIFLICFSPKFHTNC
jgi:hypothetical protein